MKRLLAMLAFFVLVGGAQAACNDCVMQLIPVTNSVCQGEPAVYDLKISNAFGMSKAITLSAAGDVALLTDMPSQIVMGPYETTVLRVNFTPTEPAVGQHRIRVTASGYGAEDSDDTLFIVNDCYGAGLTISQPSLDLCEDSTGKIEFTILNNGQKPDSYELSVSAPQELGVFLDSGRASLEPGVSAEGSITITPKVAEYGKYEISLDLRSQLKSVSEKVVVNLNNCYHTSVSAPAAFETCPDAGLTYTATVKNSGSSPDDYDLVASGCQAKLDVSKVRLLPGESKDVKVTLKPVIGECALTLTATSVYDSSSAATQVKVMACYGVDVELLPSERSACHGQSVSYAFKVKNTGFYTDEYVLDMGSLNGLLEKKVFNLAKGEEDGASFSIAGAWCSTSDIPFTVKVAGRAEDAEKGILKLMPPGETCAALDLTTELDKTEIDCAGDAYVFYVKNTGYAEQAVNFSVSGLKGYTLQPDEVTLLPLESRQIALYLMPSDLLNKTITIVATSEYKSAYLTLDIDFDGPACAVSLPSLEPQEPEEPAEPQEPEEFPTKSPTGAATSFGNMLIMFGVVVIIAPFVLLSVFVLTKRRPAGGRDFSFPEVGGQKRGGDNVERLAAIKEAISKTEK